MSIDGGFTLFFVGGIVLFVIVEILLESWSGSRFKKRLSKVPTGATYNKEHAREALDKSMQEGWTGLIALGTLLVLTAILVLPDFSLRTIMMGCSGVGLVLVAVTFGGSGKRRIVTSGLQGAILDAMQTGRDEQVRDLMEFAKGFKSEKIQLLVVQALEKWGGRTSLVMLEELWEQVRRDNSDASAGLKERTRNALAKVRFAEKDAQRGNPKRLRELALEYHFYRRLGKAAADFDAYNLRWLLGESPGNNYSYHSRQEELHASFPGVFCRKCHVRGEFWENEHYTEVVCKHCKEARHLIKNVKHVRGVLGKGQEVQFGGILEVSLWDEAEKKTVYAEIDSLSFGEMGETDADWAVASVVEKLLNELPAEKVPVPLDNPPPKGLSNNAIHQLASLTRLLPDHHLEHYENHPLKNQNN